MSRQVIPFNLADAFQAARFAQEQSIARQRQEEGALRIQQMEQAINQARDAEDRARLLPEAFQAVEERGDAGLLNALDPDYAIRQRMALDQAKTLGQQRKARREEIGVEKDELDVQNAQADVQLRNARIIENGARVALRNAGALPAVRQQIQQLTGFTLPEDPRELETVVAQAQSFSAESPEISGKMRVFREAQQNPEFAVELRRQEEQRLKEKRAGRTTVNVDARERSELTGGTKTDLQKQSIELRRTQRLLNQINEFNPERFLTLSGRTGTGVGKLMAGVSPEFLRGAAESVGLQGDDAVNFVSDARKFKSAVERYFTAAKVAATGAAASVREIERLEQGVLSGNLDPVSFQAALEDAMAEVEFAQGQVNDALRNEGIDVGDRSPQRRGGAAGQSTPSGPPNISAAQSRVRELQTRNTPIEEIQKIISAEFPDVAAQFGGRR